MASARLMPIALTLMRTSFGPGAGTWVSTNSRTSGPPACANLIVRDMVVSVKSGWGRGIRRGLKRRWWFWLHPATPRRVPRPGNPFSHARRRPRKRRRCKGERQLVLQTVRQVRIRREVAAECDKVGNTGFDDGLGALAVEAAGRDDRV